MVDMEEVRLPGSSVTPHTTHRTVLLRVVGFTFGTALAAGALHFALGLAGPIFGFWPGMMVPQELRQASIVRTIHNGVEVYVPANVGYVRTLAAKGESVSIGKMGTHVLAVRKEGDQWILEDNGIELSRAAQKIAAPSYAPTTGMVLFSEEIKRESVARQGEKVPSVSIVNPSDFEIHLSSPRKQATDKIIGGYAPLFVNDTQFLFFNHGGVYMYDIQSGTARKVLERTIPLIFGSVLQSPDRTLISFSDIEKKTSYVYKVSDSGLIPVLEIPELLMKPALSNTALYELKSYVNGSEIWKYDFGDTTPHLVRTLPRSLSVSGIVF